METKCRSPAPAVRSWRGDVESATEHTGDFSEEAKVNSFFKIFFYPFFILPKIKISVQEKINSQSQVIYF